MKKNSSKVFILFLFVAVFPRCSQEILRVPAVKMHEKDPFKATMVSSQFFSIDAAGDQVVNGRKGTLLLFPKGSLVDKNGKIYKKTAKIELAEALSIDEMLLSNLMTTADGKPLITDGMIYFNAFDSEGNALYINPDIPMHIEIPTRSKKPGMSAYQGVRDENGNMNWINPKPVNQFLIPVDLHTLDFLPEGFQKEVENSLPFGNYKEALPGLADSLYYSFSAPSMQQVLRGFVVTNYNEPYYNLNKEVIDGAYTDESYALEFAHTNGPAEHGEAENMEIDPAIIKTLKTEPFQNTLIATREFEKRLQTIYKTCN